MTEQTQHTKPSADEAPTPEEEQAAERSAERADPEVKEHYQEMTERGVRQKGEGRLP